MDMAMHTIMHTITDINMDTVIIMATDMVTMTSLKIDFLNK